MFDLTRRSFAAASFAVLGAAALVGAAQGDDVSRFNIDFEALGQKALQRAGLGDVPVEEISTENLIEKSMLTMRVGIYDICLSKAASKNKMKAGNFVDLAGALLDTQSTFLDWVGPAAPGLKDARKDIKTLKSWLKGVRGDVLAALDDDGLGEVTALVKSSGKVIEAQARFGSYMATGAPLGLAREGEMVEQIVLAPDRREFLEMVSAFGLIYPDQQYIYWDNNVLTWTNTHCNDVTVVALEFADLGSTTSGAFGGIGMNSRTATGMAQQISQLAAGSMIDNLYGSKIPPSMAGAFAVNLVVDIFGECNTRVDGDLKSRRTEAREIFVPGGRSEGGALPPNMADSRWRTEQGADRFLTALQASQAAGEGDAKKKSEKTHFFQIHTDSENARKTLKAPFLGSGAAARDIVVPDDYFGDSQELFRSYRTAFTHWLMTEGMKGKKKSVATFATLLTKLAEAEPEDEILESTIEELYGMPLSAESPSKKDLEGRFLIWLAKQ